jgi:hypothetical protein
MLILIFHHVSEEMGGITKMDWLVFICGFLIGACAVLMGITGALIYNSASKPPPVPLWEVLDREGNPLR